MKKILFVDDSMFIRKFFGPKLQNAGYQVIMANDGKEAINKSITMSPSIIILDLDMPSFNGRDAAFSIRSNPATAQIPILIASAHINPMIVEVLQDIGIKDYLAKPYTIDKLVEKIKELTE